MDFNLHPEEAASLASYDPEERRVSIFTDNEIGRADAQTIAIRVGARVMFSGTIVEGLGRLTTYPVGDVVFVDVAHNGGAELDMFLDRLETLAQIDRLPVLVNSAPECLDRVASRLTAPSIALLCQASASDWVAALAMFGAIRDPALHESVVDDSVRLQRLADEVQRIARTLADLMANEPAPLRAVSDTIVGFRPQPVGYTRAPEAITASDVRGVIRSRRMRDQFFRSDLFADPAWDMLLDLMAARLERVQVAVSSLCIAAAVPPTTALRWIKTMCENGMFIRIADPEDGRRVFIELSESVASRMTAYLNAVRAQGGLAI